MNRWPASTCLTSALGWGAVDSGAQGAVGLAARLDVVAPEEPVDEPLVSAPPPKSRDAMLDVSVMFTGLKADGHAHWDQPAHSSQLTDGALRTGRRRPLARALGTMR